MANSIACRHPAIASLLVSPSLRIKRQATNQGEKSESCAARTYDRFQRIDELESFRHALAHRIPLYIPPRVVSKENAETYNFLERRKAKAGRRGDFKKYQQLSAAQEALVRF